MRRWFVTATLFGLQLVTVFTFASGAAALIAMLVGNATSDNVVWVRPILQTAQHIALSFLPAAIAAFLLMPPRRQIVGSQFFPPADALPAITTVLMLVLPLLATWHVATLGTWWGETVGTVQQVRSGDADPLGLWLIPAAPVAALPALATMSVVVIALTSATVLCGRPAVAARVLAACAALQTGLVLGGLLLLEGMRTLVARLMSLLDRSPDDRIPAAVTEAMTRHDTFAVTLFLWLGWTAAGYWIAAALTWYFDNALRRSEWSSRAEPGLPTAAAATTLLGEPLQRASPQTVVPARAAVFQHDNYAVRLQTSWLAAAFRLGHDEYTIAPLPAGRTDPTFSFAQRSGVLRQEPSGPELLRVRRLTAGLGKNRYAVVDSTEGRTVAILEQSEQDWAVRDASDTPIAYVEEVEARSGFRRYTASVDAEEICRFTWAMQGLGVWTAVLEVEFLDRATRRFDRSLAMALAPLLEQQARRNSQFYS